MKPERLDRLASIAVACFVLVGLALRLWVAFGEDGYYYIDELYQSFEPAHALVFGYASLPFEYVDGLRSWLLPALLAVPMRLCAALGQDRPELYLGLGKALIGVLGLTTAGAAALLARPLGGVWGARLAVVVIALSAPVVYLQPRGLTESASMPLVAWGLALCATGRLPAVGGLLLALAAGLRLHNALFLPLGLLAPALLRSPRQLLGAGLGAAAGLLLVGALDRLTWGGWFHSWVAYLRFQAEMGGLSAFNPQPPGALSRAFLHSHGWTALPLGLCVLAATRRQPWLVVAALLPVALHEAVPYKQLRFVLPALPLLAAAAGVGAVRLGQRLGHPAAVAGPLLLASALSAQRLPDLTFGDLGQGFVARPERSAWDFQGGVHRLMALAGRDPTLCGLMVEGRGRILFGGYAWLHAPVPLYDKDGPGAQDGYYSHSIASRPILPGEELLAVDGHYRLLRVHPGPCRPDPDWSWQLN